MTNWKQIIDNFLRVSDPEGDYDHYSPAGASEEQLTMLEANLGVSLPPELCDFYRHCNGLGLVPRDGSSMPLFVRPTHELVEYIQLCRSSFSESHLKYAMGSCSAN
ncbi:SMI1/KNR4 family protein [Pirellulaceae bacterium SH449]